MTYSDVPMEASLKQPQKSLDLDSLINKDIISLYASQIEELYGLELTLTQESQPDYKSIYICGNRCCYLKVSEKKKVDKSFHEYEKAVDNFIRLIEEWGSQSYCAKEYGLNLQKEKIKNGSIEDSERKDSLTGTLSKNYFISRLQVLDRAEVAPVALIQANINDWKFVFDHYGINESDRLIRIVAEILLKLCKSEYLIGRWDGDVFNIVIPMPEAGEAEKYVQDAICAAEAIEDSILAPSVAFGIAYKENVEEALIDKISDAEYEMFNHKLLQKSMPGYQTRLEKGLR